MTSVKKARRSTSATTRGTSPKLSKSILTTDQQAAITRLFENDETFLIAPTGTGKTIMILTAAAELMAEGVISRLLVIAPLTVCLTAWTTEPGKWEHLEGLKVAIACGSPAERREAILSDADIVVVNEENVPWLFTGAPKAGFDGIVIDETSKWGDTGGTRFKALRHKMKHFKWRVGMTAQPCSEDWVKLFGQMLLIDLGKALGTARGRYLKKYFYSTDWDHRNWEVLPGKDAEIADAIRSVVHVVPDYKDELPAKHIHYEMLDMPAAAANAYKRMRIDSLLDIGGGVKVKARTRAALSGKLEQLANGFLYLADTPGTNREWHLTHSVKAVWLRGRVGDIVYEGGASVLIVYWYAADLAWLRRAFPDALEFGSGNNTAEVMAQWRKHRGQIMLIHPASVGHGVDGLQEMCSRQLWVNPVWSGDKMHQTIGRLDRRGQLYEVFIEIAVMRGTIDEVKVASVNGKGKYNELFLEHLAE